MIPIGARGKTEDGSIVVEFRGKYISCVRFKQSKITCVSNEYLALNKGCEKLPNRFFKEICSINSIIPPNSRYILFVSTDC